MATIAEKMRKRLEENPNIKTFNFDWPPQEEVTTRLRDILESEVDEKYYLSEEKTAKLIAQLNGNAEGEKGRFLIDDQGRTTKELKPLQISPTLRREMHGNEPRVVEPQIEQFTQGDGVSCCIDANYTKGTAPGNVGKGRRIHVVEEVRPVLTPDRETKRQNGRRFKDDGEESFTLTAQDRHGIAVGTPPRYRIRKLTPRECFRLQGFPDSEFDKLVAAGISNSQLYKMAGNAVTVNVIDAIGRRLLPYLN